MRTDEGKGIPNPLGVTGLILANSKYSYAVVDYDPDWKLVSKCNGCSTTLFYGPAEAHLSSNRFICTCGREVLIKE